MEDQLFIPKKIKVGYQKRNDTYTKKLAYVIYYDSKGVLRKEKSFEGWRDKKIPTDEHENKPRSGFVLNKDVQRMNEYYGSGRNMIRVYDDRGIEFEITCDNLIFILMNTNCNKRELEGEFVYAWYGKELMLLPVGCEEYKTSQKFTALQSGKISAKSLVPGCSYMTKQMEELIYLGRFDFYENSYNYDTSKYSFTASLQYVFVDKENEIVHFSSLSTLASQNSDVPVYNYAELMDMFSKSEHASLMEKIVVEKIDKIIYPKVDLALGRDDYYFNECVYVKKRNDIFEQYKPANEYVENKIRAKDKQEFLEAHNNSADAIAYINAIENDDENDAEDFEVYLTDMPIYKLKYRYLNYEGNNFNLKTNEFQDAPGWDYEKKNIKKEELIELLDLYKIYVITKNGGKIPIEKYYES